MAESESPQERLSQSGHTARCSTPRATIIRNNETSNRNWYKAKNWSGKLLASIATAGLWLLGTIQGWFQVETLLWAGGALALAAIGLVTLLRHRKRRQALSMRDSALW
jgi:hypothetical protein